MRTDDLNIFESSMLVSDRGTKENAMMKKSSSDVHSKLSQNCAHQHVLRNAFKHCLLSETRNDELIQKREHLLREHVVDNRKFDPRDPFPRCKLTRRATIELVGIENKMHVLSRCDCGA